jgi:hypothetical protein
MPIRPECRALYPANWQELSREIRFEPVSSRFSGAMRAWHVDQGRSCRMCLRRMHP